MRVGRIVIAPRLVNKATADEGQLLGDLLEEEQDECVTVLGPCVEEH
jgi:hypothetical protein